MSKILKLKGVFLEITCKKNEKKNEKKITPHLVTKYLKKLMKFQQNLTNTISIMFANMKKIQQIFIEDMDSII